MKDLIFIFFRYMTKFTLGNVFNVMMVLVVMGSLLFSKEANSWSSASEFQVRYPNYMKIEDIHQQELQFGTYMTEGYVVKIYQCPDCFTGFNCIPCLPNHFVLATKKGGVSKLAKNQQITLITDQIKTVSLGGYYRCLFQVTDVKTLNGKTNNLRLIHAQSLKPPIE